MRLAVVFAVVFAVFSRMQGRWLSGILIPVGGPKRRFRIHPNLLNKNEKLPVDIPRVCPCCKSGKWCEMARFGLIRRRKSIARKIIKETAS
jgi:hypothetical protein